MKNILVVDDNESVLTTISGFLRGLYTVHPVNSGDGALEFLESHRPDLILLDVKMPQMSISDLMKILKSDKESSDIPVILLSGVEDEASEAHAFELGAADCIHKPVNGVVLLARIKLHLELETYRRGLQELVDLKTAHILQREKITIDLLARVNEFRDEDTGNHVKRTSGYVCAIMDNMSGDLPPSYHISKDCYDDIKKSTPLHDIGKISIPDSILLKPGRLTEDEYEIMKTHVKSGADLLQDAIDESDGPSFLDVALEIVLTHHERWDGTGYPHRLDGEDIPLSGRIMAIADVYDALTSKRPYKPAFPHEEAMAIIIKGSGNHFDPTLVDIFTRIQFDILEISNRYQTEDF